MFNFFNFIGAFILCARNQEGHEYTFSLKHFIFKGLLLLVFVALSLINHACLLFDEIFLFFYRFTRISNPILIVGVPRTGTTFLFRAMAEDRENFTCFTLMEIIFAPSLVQKYLFYAVYRLDKVTGHPLKKALLFIERKTVSAYARIHFLGYFKPEEDEFMLLHIFSTVMLKYFFPGSRVFDKYIEFDENVPEWEKRNIFNFQKRCIKKHLFFWKTIHGKQKTFLCKNPIYSPKVNSLPAFFPGLRMIITIRNMEEVIPSFISMNAAVLRSLHHTQKPYPNAGIARDVIVAWAATLSSKTSTMDERRKYLCRYGDLTDSIKNAVLAIYAHFEIPLRDDYLSMLEKKEEQQHRYRSDHQYDLREIKKAITRA